MPACSMAAVKSANVPAVSSSNGIVAENTVFIPFIGVFVAAPPNACKLLLICISYSSMESAAKKLFPAVRKRNVLALG